MHPPSLLVSLSHSLFWLVLLDNFFRSSQQVKEEEAAHQAAGQAGANVLDPLLKYLAKNFVSARDLDLKLLGMFHIFDVEGRNKLSYQDMALGVQRASPATSTTYLSEEDYFEMTENLAMCQSDGTLDLHGFKTVMLKKLRWYLQRRSAEAALYMQAPAEVEALLLNTKFLMVETHLMTEALLSSPAPRLNECMPPAASSRSAGGSRSLAPTSTNTMQRSASIENDLLFANSFKNGEIFASFKSVSERSEIEPQAKRLPGTPDSNGSGVMTVCNAASGEASITGGAARAHAELGAEPPKLSGFKQVDAGTDASHKAPCQCCVVVRASFTEGIRDADAS